MDKNTPFERCIITGFLRSITGRDEPSESTGDGKLTWKDIVLPCALFAFILIIFYIGTNFDGIPIHVN